MPDFYVSPETSKFEAGKYRKIGACLSLGKAGITYVFLADIAKYRLGTV
ncbi:MAG: hypothetical protein JW912_02780 [Sedimentisphaerales bacterium]|nr:hypothetical protein [Sedimentisphaerales bacterium]